jgi:hypothetical protein
VEYRNGFLEMSCTNTPYTKGKNEFEKNGNNTILERMENNILKCITHGR